MAFSQAKERIIALLQLYRLDVAVISFGAYVAGLVFSGGVSLTDLPVGLGISLITFNYIYSLNSIEDRHVDLVNKPQRPIPAGKLPLSIARRYVTFMLVLSVAYPLIVQTDMINLALFLFLPLLGWAYSRPPLHLKTKLTLAAISIALMYTTPVAIGLTSRMDALGSVHAALLGFIFLFCLSIVPLKDIEDVAGDQLHGTKTLLALLGSNRLLGLSLTGLITSMALVLLADLAFPITVLLVAFSGATGALIAAFVLLRLPRRYLYRSILILVATLGLLFALNTLVFGGSL